MPGESYFMAFGGLGLSLAGFAGLIAALKTADEVSAPITAYRIRVIVVLGLALVFVGFGTVAAYSVFGDVSTAVRVGTILLALTFIRGLLIDTRPGPAWQLGSESQRWFSIGVLGLMLVAAIGNLMLASVPFLQALMILGLVGPLTIFYNTIKDATEVRAPVNEDHRQ